MVPFSSAATEKLEAECPRSYFHENFLQLVPFPPQASLGTIWKYGSASFSTRANEGRVFSRSK